MSNGNRDAHRHDPSVVTYYSIIAGLGNPGREYARTRHNAGFMVLDQLAERWNASWTAQKKFHAKLARMVREKRKVILCQPQTFMNSSGASIGPLAAYYQVRSADTLVVVDDADLPFGQIRLRGQGSSGGHHGLASVEQHLGTRDYPRLRVGIGRTERGLREITGHVLSQFERSELPLLEKVLQRACDQVECWLTAGLQQAMNQFNSVIKIEET